jgi:hypothetical protein
MCVLVTYTYQRLFTGKRIGSLVKPDWFVFQTINDSISYNSPAPFYILPGMPYQAGLAVAVDRFRLNGRYFLYGC